jgi:hypothetical protein
VSRENSFPEEPTYQSHPNTINTDTSTLFPKHVNVPPPDYAMETPLEKTAIKRKTVLEVTLNAILVSSILYNTVVSRSC